MVHIRVIECWAEGTQEQVPIGKQGKIYSSVCDDRSPSVRSLYGLSVIVARESLLRSLPLSGVSAHFFARRHHGGPDWIYAMLIFSSLAVAAAT